MNDVVIDYQVGDLFKHPYWNEVIRIMSFDDYIVKYELIKEGPRLGITRMNSFHRTSTYERDLIRMCLMERVLYEVG